MIHEFRVKHHGVVEIHYLLLATTVQEVNVITFQADGCAHVEEVWPGDIVGLPDAKVETTSDGRHFEAVAVSDAFEGKSSIQRQRMLMDTVKAEIASDELHVLSIKTAVS